MDEVEYHDYHDWKVFFLGALLMLNVALIWLFGIRTTDYELRIRSLEQRQTALEISQVFALEKTLTATDTMVAEVYSLLGIPKKKGAPKSPDGSVKE